MNNYNALYAIKENSIIDNSIRQELLKIGVDTEYANSTYDLISKIQLKEPILLIIDGDKYLINEDFLSLFSIESSLFVPCVIVLNCKPFQLPKQNFNNIFFFDKTLYIRKIEKLVSDIISKRIEYKNQLQNLTKREENICSTLIKLGITQKSIGFSYIRDCIMELIDKDCLAMNFDTCLYGPISKKHNTTHAGLERSMRYAINKAWETSTLSQFTYHNRIVFTTRPSIKQLVYAIASSIRSYERTFKLAQLPNINSLFILEA